MKLSDISPQAMTAIVNVALDQAARVADGIDVERAALVSDLDLTTEECMAVFIAAVIDRASHPPTESRCLWCWRADGFRPEAFAELPEYDLEEAQAHLVACPNNPTSGARAVREMQALLEKFMTEPGADASTKVTLGEVRYQIEAALERVAPTTLPEATTLGPAPDLSSLVIHHGVKVREPTPEQRAARVIDPVSIEVTPPVEIFDREWVESDPFRPLHVAEGCQHGVTFDEQRAQGMSAGEVRFRWPRLDGECPLGCGYRGTHYASKAHYVWGDW